MAEDLFGDIPAANPAPKVGPDFDVALKFLRKLRPGRAVHNLVARKPDTFVTLDDGRTIPDIKGITLDARDEEGIRDFIRKHTARGCDLYYSVNEVSPHTGHKKASADTIVRLHGVYIDVDPRKAKEGENPAEVFAQERWRLMAMAKALAADLIAPPTYIVDSGSGIQAVWLVDKPVDKTELLEARFRAHSYGAYTLHREAGADSTVYNIDRILRLPGTVNFQSEKKRKQGRQEAPTRLLSWTGDRYSPEALDAVSPYVVPPRSAGGSGVVGSVKCDWPLVEGVVELADIDEDVRDRLAAWRSADSKNDALWSGRFRDGGAQDETGSGLAFTLIGRLKRSGLFNITESGMLCRAWGLAGGYPVDARDLERCWGRSAEGPVLTTAEDDFEVVDVGAELEEFERRLAEDRAARAADFADGTVDLIGGTPVTSRASEPAAPPSRRDSAAAGTGANRSKALMASDLLGKTGSNNDAREVLNEKYAFVLMSSGHAIVRETVTQAGALRREFVKEDTFHKLHASADFWPEGAKKPVSLTKSWMEWPKRRTYLGVVFEPGRDVPGYVNQWTGFAVTPNSEDAEQRCGLFLDMVKQSICGHDETSYRWVMTWLAQMFQEPRRKPPTALVLKGGKGVGKNTFGEMVGKLLGEHFKMLTSAKEVTGNFNAHMERCLLAFVDEAFWSGDKAADSALKTQITGHTRRVERKGMESYDVPNYTRYIIAGNEDWVVPASEDERRYNCLETPGGHANDMDYWQAIRDQMDGGGYEALLHILLTWDLKAIDIRRLLKTKALADQKMESLDPIGRWVHESLRAGYLLGCEEGFEGTEWPERVGTAEILRYVQRYMRDHNIRAWVPSIDKIGRRLKTILPGVHRKQANDKKSYFYVLPAIEDARANFDKFIGHPIAWDGE